MQFWKAALLLSTVVSTVSVFADESTNKRKKKRRRLTPNDGTNHRVVVTYHEGHDQILADCEGRDGCEMNGDLMRINRVAMTVDEAGLEALWDSDLVDDVESDVRKTLIPTIPSANRRELLGCDGGECNDLYGVTQVQAVQSWDVGQRGAGIKVCVIDSGLASTHQDFTRTRISGYTGSDSAGNWQQDLNGHGTHVAGTIAAADNGNGIIGVSPDAEMYIVKVFSGRGGNWAWGAELEDAAFACQDAGANIISMSLGGPAAPGEREAFQKLWDEGIVSIAAAGNDGNTAFSYPASHPTVISVAANNEAGNRASFSQYNSQVDVSAPGVSVKSCVPSNGYDFYDGTSMATPHVAGVAALVWGSKPGATNEQVRQAIESTCLDRGSAGRDNMYGHGIVQALDAINALNGGNPPPPPPPGTPSPVAPPPPPGVTPAPVAPPTGGTCSGGLSKVVFNVAADYWGEEIGTELKIDGGAEIFSYSDYASEVLTSHDECLDLSNTCYRFSITDSLCDGLAFGGYYSIEVDGNEVRRASDYGCGDVYKFGSCGGGGGGGGGDEEDNGNCPDNKDLLELEIQVDNVFRENQWFVTRGTQTLRTWGPWGPNAYREKSMCIRKNRCHTVKVTDSYGDGLCCGYGAGYTRIYKNKRLVATFDVFDAEDSVDINC